MDRDARRVSTKGVPFGRVNDNIDLDLPSKLSSRDDIRGVFIYRWFMGSIGFGVASTGGEWLRWWPKSCLEPRLNLGGCDWAFELDSSYI